MDDVMNALSAQIIADWRTFEPIRKHIMEEGARRYPALALDSQGIDSVYWPTFKWLAEENAKWVQKVTSTEGAGAKPVGPPAEKG